MCKVHTERLELDADFSLVIDHHGIPLEQCLTWGYHTFKLATSSSLL